MSATVARDETVHEAPSARQQAVLDAVLALLVEEGDQLTMDAVARRASCSKETLYKWFGDRDGLLTATVRWQASRVHAGRDAAGVLDAATLRERLLDFAVTWLDVIAGRHLGGAESHRHRACRLAQGQPRRHRASERAAGHRRAGQARARSGPRRPGSSPSRTARPPFRTFFGLVGRDVQIRLLLGDALDLDAAEIRRDAARARRPVPGPLRPGPSLTPHEERNQPMRVYYDRDADLNLIKGQEGRHRRLRQPGPCPRPQPA